MPVYDDEADRFDSNSGKEVRREMLKEKPPRGPAGRTQYNDQRRDMIPYPFLYPSSGAMPYPNTFHPIVNNYNISANPFTKSGIDRISTIHEDYLLPSVVGEKNTTIASRRAIYNLIRNMILNNIDGQEIDLGSRLNESLFSKVSMLEAHPYHYATSLSNPYRTNPFDMIVIRTGYPIRYNPDTTMVKLGRENVSMNLRLYRLSNAEFRYATLAFFTQRELNPWRELLYYQEVRDTIVQKVASPHFVLAYGYFMCRSKINYDEINRARGDSHALQRYRTLRLQKCQQKIAEKRGAMRIMGMLAGPSRTTQTYRMGGILLVDSSNKVLLIRDTTTNRFREFGSDFKKTANDRDEFRKLVAWTAMRASRYQLSFDWAHLDEARYSYDYTEPTSPHPIFKCYVLQSATSLTEDLIDDGLLLDLTGMGPRDVDIIPSLDPLTRNILTQYIGAGTLLPTTSSTVTIQTQKERSRLEYVRFQDGYARNLTSQITDVTLIQDSNVSLMILTESPTYNIMQWCSRKYDVVTGAVMKMERLGIYPDDIWFSILFQILQGSYTMLAKNLFIRGLTLVDSIFIKDLPVLSNQFWIYTIDGFDFYVPNKGYLVQFDLGGLERANVESKVSLPDEHNVEYVDFADEVKDLFVGTAFTANVSIYTNQPSQEVMTKMTAIRGDIDRSLPLRPPPPPPPGPPARRPFQTSAQIQEILLRTILQQLPMFYHPKIGYELTADEEKSLSRTPPTSVRKGEIVAFQDMVRGSGPIWKWGYVWENPRGTYQIYSRQPDGSMYMLPKARGFLRTFASSARNLDLMLPPNQQIMGSPRLNMENCIEHYTV